MPGNTAHTDGRRLICANSRFDVFFDRVDEPGGFSLPDYLVVAPRNRCVNGVTGVAVLPVMDGSFGLLRMFRHAVGMLTWEIPRGFIDKGEEPVSAAARELHEETGLACEPAHIVPLGCVLPEAGILAGRIQLFAACKCRQDRPFVSSELGLREFHMVDAGKMHRMVMESEIEDPSSIAAYCRYCARRES